MEVVLTVLCLLSTLMPETHGAHSTTTKSPTKIFHNKPIIGVPALSVLGSNPYKFIFHDHGGIGYHVHINGQHHGHTHAPAATTTTTTQQGCRYWCKTSENAYYCCPHGHPTTTTTRPVTAKPGSCPIVRPICPKYSGPPQLCNTDNSCPGTNKCCHDVCLQQNVCKPITHTIIYGK